MNGKGVRIFTDVTVLSQSAHRVRLAACLLIFILLLSSKNFVLTDNF